MTKTNELIEANGKTYLFNFSFNRACDVERACEGRPLGEILRAATEGGMSEMRTMLRHALRDEEGQMPGESEAGDVIAAVGLNDVAKRLTGAFAALMKPRDAR